MGRPRPRRFATLSLGLATAVLAGGIAPAQAATAATSASNPLIVLLGDSYSAGEGLGSYEKGTDTASNQCHRSNDAWGRQLKLPGQTRTVASRAASGDIQLQFLACSGATMNELRDTSRFGETPQIDRMKAGAADVFVTIGGNDLGFAPILQYCATHKCTGTEGIIEDARASLNRGYVRQELEQTLRAIRTKAGTSARIHLVGYPELFDAPSCTNAKPITGPEAVMLNGLGSRLETEQRAAAAATGVQFVSVRKHFAGHGECRKGTDETGNWLFWLTDGILSVRAMHPTSMGAKQYATIVQGTLALTRKAASLGSATTGSLGAATCRTKSTGCWMDTSKGRIWYSPATSARWLSSAMEKRYLALGEETGTLGYPTSDANCKLKPAGCRQHFEDGTMMSSAKGTFWTRGQIRDKYESMKWQASILGYPTSDRSCGLPDSGCVQTFAGGRIYSSSKAGAHFTRGQILTRYLALGGPKGKLGYPTGDRVCATNSDCRQAFQDGRLYSASNVKGAKWVHGRILDAYVANGQQAGRLGTPTTDEMAWCGMRASFFEHGRIVWNGSVAYLQMTTSRTCPTGPTPV